jgi:small ligand-binding sensory domain FIST
MKIVTAISHDVIGNEAAGALINDVAARLDGAPADLCLLFASAHYEDDVAAITLQVHEALGPRAFVGCTGEAVICDQTEFEGQPAVVLWAANLPGVKLTSFHLSHEDLERLDTADAVVDAVGVTPGDLPYFLLLADPFSFNPLGLLDVLGQVFPSRPAIGGMASAADRAEQNVIVFGGQALRFGLAGVALSGDIHIDTVVSQGCRPIGRHLVITRADRNVIYGLGGRPPLKVVREILEECPTRDKELARRGLFIGRVINECQPTFARGDFLIRNPIGFDQSTGAMAVNDLVRAGQTIQFHVRDGQTAAEDLSTLLLPAHREGSALGALLFSCNGRGTRLFSDRSHDARAVASSQGTIPLAGLFCAGEIGPVGNRNFLHGHTASIGLLRPRAR